MLPYNCGLVEVGGRAITLVFPHTGKRAQLSLWEPCVAASLSLSGPAFDILCFLVLGQHKTGKKGTSDQILTGLAWRGSTSHVNRGWRVGAAPTSCILPLSVSDTHACARARTPSPPPHVIPQIVKIGRRTHWQRNTETSRRCLNPLLEPSTSSPYVLNFLSCFIHFSYSFPAPHLEKINPMRKKEPWFLLCHVCRNIAPKFFL